MFSADWDNLLGNAKHSAPASGPLNLPLQLAWTHNVGANLYMTSPLIHKGKIIVASVDEDLKGAGCISGGRKNRFLRRFIWMNIILII